MTGLCVTAFFSHRYPNSDDKAAKRWRMVMPLKVRLSRSSRQAMTCALVTLRQLTVPPHGCRLQRTKV